MTTQPTAGAVSAAAGTLMMADGTGVSLRPVGPSDRDGLVALFARLTPESRYQRFRSPKRELTPRELTFFTDIDHLNHEAVAAIDERDNSIVGVARYVRDADRPAAAELAIEVADAFQRNGIGTALASLTIERAQVNGLARLTATTLWENHAARRLLRRVGFRARDSRGREIEHELRLEDLAPACGAEPACEVRKPLRGPEPAMNDPRDLAGSRPANSRTGVVRDREGVLPIRLHRIHSNRKEPANVTVPVPPTHAQEAHPAATVGGRSALATSTASHHPGCSRASPQPHFATPPTRVWVVAPGSPRATREEGPTNTMTTEEVSK